MIRIRPEKIFEGQEAKGRIPVWCEYEDRQLVRSNFLLRNPKSLSESLITAALHGLCPKEFNPGDAELADPARIFD